MACPALHCIALHLQLVARLQPGLREAEVRYAADLLVAALPYNSASYSEDDIIYAVRQAAAIERQVEERRLPPDVAALLGRLAEDVTGLGGGGGDRAAAQQLFREADRSRRGSLPLGEQVRLLQRLSQAPPHAVMWLSVALHHYAAAALAGVADMTFEELCHALGTLAAAAATGPGAPPALYGGQQVQQQPYGAPPQYGGQAEGYGPQVGHYPGHAPGPAATAATAPYGQPPYPYPGYPPAYGQPGQPYPYPAAPSQGQPQPYGRHPPPYAAGGQYQAQPPYPYPPGPEGPLVQQPYSPYGSPPGSPRPGQYGQYGPAVPPSGGGYAPAPATAQYGGGGGTWMDPAAAAGQMVMAGMAPPPSSAPGFVGGSAYYMWTQQNRQAVLERCGCMYV